MWFEAPDMGKPRPLSLIIFVIFACCTTSFAGMQNPNSSGYLSSQLAIDSVGPSSGPATGGTTVTIAGTGFTHSASVLFGGAPASAVAYISSTQLLVTTPAHASGTVSISITENPHNQSAALGGAYTYTAPSSTAGSNSISTSLSLSGISPSQGPTSGGTAVTITGTGFQTGTTVEFGTVQSTAVTVTSSTQINAVSPAESSGSVSVTVAGSNSQSASLPLAFTYQSGPAVSSVSPQTGPVTGGTTVTILGSGFQSGASVAFGGIAAISVNLVSSTEIQAVTPGSPAGTISVAVANPDSQTGTLTSAFTFFHTVSLTWTASTSTVAGYNVYRSSTSGGPYVKLNSTIVPGASFTDNSVQAGQTYFYVTTSVNSNNTESVYSNQAQTTVPSP